MSKQVEVKEVENPFEAFQFLDKPAKTESKEKVDKVEDKADDISDEAKVALEKAKKEADEAAKKKAEKAKTEEVVEEEEPETIETPEEVIEENEFLGFAKFLNEKGTIDLEETDKVESEDDLDKLINKTVNNKFESYKQSLPEDGQKFLEFVQNGGKPADFHKYYYGDASFEEFTVDTEEDQKYIITESLKMEGYTDEEIEEEITDATDIGKLDKKAQTHLKKLQKFEKEQKKALLEAQKVYAQEQEEVRKSEWDKFRKGLFDKETIAGFNFTDKMKKDTWDYMTRTVDKKTGETQYQIDSKENEDARYLFAYFLKNKYDIKALEKQVETKQVSKLKAKLSNYTDSRQKMRSATSHKKDDIDESNPFSVWKKTLNT